MASEARAAGWGGLAAVSSITGLARSTTKGLDKMASALVAVGHKIGPYSVRKLLTKLGFSRQVNRKADEGASHPDRKTTTKTGLKVESDLDTTPR